MSTISSAKTPSELSPLKQAYLALERARARIKTLEAGPRDPIAIIGIGCRFPGGCDSVESYWKMLRNGMDAVTEVPAERWSNDEHYDPDPDAPGKICTKYGAFLNDFDKFDPEFFGISPREAANIDPQQRLLLETTWEAIERAGIAPESLYRSPTGVFLGICNQDYAYLIGAVRAEIQAYLGTGSSLSAAAGRLSYLLGLQGPSMIVDTACSSSLVSLHLACQSLRQRECQLALAGGANLILTPITSAIFSKSRMLAPDGRCKTFDASADGYVRGEGIGVLLLKRLADAVADQDPIVAVIRGSAVNQDGPSSGLTVPNGPAQQDVIRQAMSNAQVTADQIAYIEAHGTGTSLGDPIELGALGAVFGPVRSAADPLYIGSVKTNIGHLEGSAGIASIIKVALMLQQQEMPVHLHFRQPTPHVDWSRLPIKVVSQRQAWPVHRPRLAGVSSFGFSGTNAHVILEAAPDRTIETAPAGPVTLTPRTTELLTLSAKSDSSLKEMSGRLGEFLQANPQLRLSDVAATLNMGRSHFPERMAVTADSTLAAAAQFLRWSRGEIGQGVRTGRVAKSAVKAAFLFPAHRQADAVQAAGLYQSQPAFRAALDECAACLKTFTHQPLNDLLFVKDQGKPVNGSDEGYWLGSFSLEYALAKLWQAWGIAPSAVMGQGIGEYVAACIAGVFRVEDGMKLTVARCRLVRQKRPDDGLLSVTAGEDQVADLMRSTGAALAVAAVQTPDEVLVVGNQAALKSFADACRQRGWGAMPVSTEDLIPHPMTDAELSGFRTAAEAVAYSPPKIPVISLATGERAGTEIATAKYWIDLLNRPARFCAGIKALSAAGITAMLELGRRPTMTMLGQRCIKSPDDSGAASVMTWLPSLRPDSPAWSTLLEALSELFLRGAAIDWKQVASGPIVRRCVLPTYPFQRERYWLVSPSGGKSTASTQKHGVQTISTGHPLLGHRLLSASDETQFTAELNSQNPRFLADHRVGGLAILPAAGYLEIALAAGRQTLKDGGPAWEIRDVSIERALPLPPNVTQSVEAILQPHPDGSQGFRFYSLEQPASSETHSPWKLHATARIQRTSAPPKAPIVLDALQRQCAEAVDVPVLYETYRSVGLDYGPMFQSLSKVWRGNGDVLAEVILPSELGEAAPHYGLHPSVMDGCLQAMGASPELRGSYVPVAIDRVTVYERLPNSVWCHVRLLPQEGDGATRCADLCVFAGDGRVLAQVDRLALRRIAVAPAGSQPAGDTAARSTSRFAQSAAAAETAKKIQAASGDERAKLVVQFLQEEVASILKRESKGLPSPERTFLELGMDSLMGLEMVYRIQNGLGVTLSEQTMLHFASIQQLADELNKRLDAKSRGESPAEGNSATSVLQANFFSEPVSASGTPWLRIVRPNPSAAVRLFCFPHLGGGASLFDRWPDDLPEQIEVCGVQLPGREERLKEPPITNFGELTESLMDVLLDHLDRPFAFFGHSGGSLIAFELARLVSARFNLAPICLGIGALWAPHLSRERVKAQGEAGLRKLLELAQPNGATGQPAPSPDTVLADLELFGSYRHESQPPLDCPILVCGGTDDGLVSADDLEAWAAYTTAAFEKQLVPGNHNTYLEQRRIWLGPLTQAMMNQVG